MSETRQQLHAHSRNAQVLWDDLTSSMAQSHLVRTTGACPHCGEHTRWVARPLTQFYRCLQCENDPVVDPSLTPPTEHHAGRGFWARLWQRAGQALSKGFSVYASWTARGRAALYDASTGNDLV